MGKVRLAQLHPWIETWDPPGIYAGIEGKGANDVADATAIEIEYCRLRGLTYIGGAVDIYKCFDQVRREIVHRLLNEAGLPPGILHAYKDFQEAISVRNTVVGCLGDVYRKPTSIPQGGGMSMMITSLLLRAWVVQMGEVYVIQRILADDLQLMCTGEGCKDQLRNFRDGFDATHKYLEDLGAKLAPKRSITLSSSTIARKWLGMHRWRRPGRTITVITDGKDLGCRMNATSNRFNWTTLTKRMRNVAEGVEALNRFKAPYDKDDLKGGGIAQGLVWVRRSSGKRERPSEATGLHHQKADLHNRAAVSGLYVRHVLLRSGPRRRYSHLDEASFCVPEIPRSEGHARGVWDWHGSVDSRPTAILERCRRW